jgi:hypothetical protein
MADADALRRRTAVAPALAPEIADGEPLMKPVVPTLPPSAAVSRVGRCRSSTEADHLLPFRFCSQSSRSAQSPAVLCARFSCRWLLAALPSKPTT